MKRILPAAFTFLIAALYIGIRLVQADLDPVGLLELGTRFSEGDPSGTEGYDGQFVFYAAMDLDPEQVADKLDDPPYRYQRILLPLLARLIGGGVASRTAWAILLINLTAHTAGVYAVSELLARHGWSRWYALIYGLWIGIFIGVGLGLHEPLAYALVAFSILMQDRGKPATAIIAATLAIFAKEITVVFWLALLATAMFERWPLRRFAVFAGTAAVYIGWQMWLAKMFGASGFGVGGGGATGFDWVPFNGLWRIGAYNPRALLVYLAVFGPVIVVPAVWGLVASIGTLLEDVGRADAYMLAANCAGIVFLPHSTFREPLGVLRFADGLVLSLLYFAIVRGHPRVMKYAVFWIAMLAILVNG